MRILWDKNKSKILKNHPKRRTSFEEAKILVEELGNHFGGNLKCDHPEQYYVVGFVDSKLITLVYEFRNDAHGEYIWLVTLWKTTEQERKRLNL